MTYSCSDLANDLENELARLGYFVAQDEDSDPSKVFDAFAALSSRYEQLLKENEILAARVMDLEIELQIERENFKGPDNFKTWRDAAIDERIKRVKAANEMKLLEKDAMRYRLLKRGQHWSTIDGIGNVLLDEALDRTIDAALQPSNARG